MKRKEKFSDPSPGNLASLQHCSQSVLGDALSTLHMMYSLGFYKEVSVVEGWEAKIRERGLSKYMVSVEDVIK